MEKKRIIFLYDEINSYHIPNTIAFLNGQFKVIWHETDFVKLFNPCAAGKHMQYGYRSPDIWRSPVPESL